MKGEKEAIRAKMASHSEELMGDAKLYGWARVRAYPGVLLNQLGQGWGTWEDEREKIIFHHALIWHLATSASSAPSTSMASGAQKQLRLGLAYTAPAKPDMKACKALNEGNITMQQPIPTNSMSVVIVWLWSIGPSLSRRRTAKGSSFQPKDFFQDNHNANPDHPLDMYSLRYDFQ